MKSPAPQTPKPGRDTRRSFTWGIRSTDISFMRVTEAEAALDGCGNCSDCSAIAKEDPARGKRLPGRVGSEGRGTP